MKGIDVSQHQGDINWSEVKNDQEFAIIRVGWGEVNNANGGELDAKAMYNITEALAKGLYIGLYVYSYAKNVQEGLLEAQFAKTILLQFPNDAFKFAIWLDVEDEKWQGDVDVNPIIDAFCTDIQNAGYKTGYYCNLNWYNNKINQDIKNKWDHWLAQYNDQPSIASCIWQYSSTGSVPGIKTNVDMNISYKDYAGTGNPAVVTPIDIQPTVGPTLTYSNPVFTTLELQRTLRMLNYGDVDLDGINGDQTQGAVINAQSSYGIDTDGIPGIITETHLRGQLQAVQSRLNELGYTCTVDGRLGDGGMETVNAVLAFQGDRGLVQDWIIGMETFTALFSSTPVPESLPPSAPVPIIQQKEGMASEHFAWSEYACECPTNSAIEGPHCDGYPATEYGQIINPVIIANMERLRQLLQNPVVVTSGIRCPSCNSHYGGVPDSQHMFGGAVDCYSPGVSVDELARVAAEAGFTEIRKYYSSGFCHLGMGGQGTIVQEW